MIYSFFPLAQKLLHKINNISGGEKPAISIISVAACCLFVPSSSVLSAMISSARLACGLFCRKAQVVFKSNYFQVVIAFKIKVNNYVQ